ncbi:hypothetical protein N0824_02719 [Microcystis sp. 0824]|uniref:hypothetical protein n=1 Tax=Microcystis sp. 0824 TaxID=1502726 RepID=UPI000D0C64D0|nr:hypothetical protein [Microcystis sp. 0824]GBF54851.1 hypothetical protein N0824_02719 [Microcystis sp. 0824]
MQQYRQSAIIGDSWAFRSQVAEQTGIIMQTPSQKTGFSKKPVFYKVLKNWRLFAQNNWNNGLNNFLY